MPEAKRPPSRSFLILILLTVSQFLIILDFTIVTVALPSIVNELGITISTVQWVVTAYGLTLAGFLLLSGRAGDAYGHKRLFIAGLIIFSLASLASGLAPNINILIVARAIQGIGGAMGSATGLSILVATFPEGKERNRALGIFGAVIGSAFVMGTISGGIITTFLGWRWVFDVTVPIGLIAAVLSARFIAMPARPPGTRAALDFPGAVTVTAGSMLFVYALTDIQVDRAVSLQSLEILALSAILLGSFLAIESRIKNPLLPLGFLRRRVVFTANIIALLTVAAFVGQVFLLTIYLQQVLGYSPLNAGLAFVPGGLTFFAMSGFFSARLVNRFGVKKVLVFGEGTAIFSYALLTQTSAAGNYLTVMLPATMIGAIGLGVAFPAYSIIGLMGAKRGEEGLASGVLNTSRQMGGPLGVATLVTIATVLDPATMGPQLYVGFVSGLDWAFVVASVLAILATVLASSIKLSGQKPQAAVDTG